MQIEFSKIAKISLKENIDFLEMIWTTKEVNIFPDDVNNLIVSLKENKFLQISGVF